MNPRVLVVVLVMTLLVGSGFIFAAARGFPVVGGEPAASGTTGESPAPVTTTPASATATTSAGPTVDRFDERRAFRDLRHQVRLGERPAGSATSRRLAGWLARRLPNGRFERVPGGLRNVVGHIPGSKPAVLVGAHYDTKDIEGFVGAEDSAGGTAAVLEVARALRRAERPKGAPEIRFVLFDGEEDPVDGGDFYAEGLRGSKAYARRHADELRAVIILDFIAQKDLELRRDESADAELWAKLRASAARVGTLDTFPDATQPAILDDHTPFLRAGVPAIDLIDFDFPCWHELCDDLTAVSARSLDRSGETVLDLLLHFKP